MQPLISVIVPVYNVEKYLPKCVSSICRQTYENLEIILVDDGSTDGSSKLCDQFAQKDTRIKVIHQKNGGSSSARNAGLNAAAGEYIGFIDSDDYPELNMYQLLIQAALETKCEIVQGMSRDYDEEGHLLKDGYRLSGNLVFIPREENFRLLMLYEGDSSMCTKLIRADFMKQFRFTEDKLNEDFELVLKMLDKVKGVYSLEKAVYNILIRGGSNQRNGFNQNLYHALIDNSRLAFAIMEQDYPSCRDVTIYFWLRQRLFYLLHIPVSRMNGDNVYYRQVLSDVKKNRKQITKCPYFTQKEKRNLVMISTLPKLSKRLHGLIMLVKRSRA